MTPRHPSDPGLDYLHTFDAEPPGVDERGGTNPSRVGGTGQSGSSHRAPFLETGLERARRLAGLPVQVHRLPVASRWPGRLAWWLLILTLAVALVVVLDFGGIDQVLR